MAGRRRREKGKKGKKEKGRKRENLFYPQLAAAGGPELRKSKARSFF